MRIASVLAPVDFSEDSARGAALALDIAQRLEARLTVLHVDGLPVYSERVAKAAAPDVWVKYLEQRDTSLMQRLREFAQPLESDRPVEFALARGSAASAIREHAETHSSDLIVISPHGAGHGDRFLLGSVSAQVAADATCPVLVARQRSPNDVVRNGQFSHPLLAVSDEALAERALAYTMILAEPHTDVHLMHVLEAFEIHMGPRLPASFQDALRESREEICTHLDRFAQRLRLAGFKPAIRVETGDPSFSILCRLESNPNGLVVVSRKSPSDRAPSLSNPAYRMVKHSPVPVLVVPGEPRQPA